MSEEITNAEDTIDSRDVITRISELRENRDSLDNSELFELDALIALDREGRNNFPSWETGTMLIRDSYFETFARKRTNTSVLFYRFVRFVSFDGVEYWGILGNTKN